MSYRLINANDLNGKISVGDYEIVLDAPYIYADLPNGLDGEYYNILKMMSEMYSENYIKLGSGTTAMTIADLVIRECRDDEVLLEVIYFLQCWLQRDCPIEKAGVMEKEGVTDEPDN